MLKSGSDSWRAMLEETLGNDSLGYTATAADKGVWIESKVLPYKMSTNPWY